MSARLSRTSAASTTRLLSNGVGSGPLIGIQKGLLLIFDEVCWWPVVPQQGISAMREANALASSLHPALHPEGRRLALHQSYGASSATTLLTNSNAYHASIGVSRCNNASKRRAASGSLHLKATHACPARRQAASTSPAPANAVMLARRISESRLAGTEESAMLPAFEARSLGRSTANAPARWGANAALRKSSLALIFVSIFTLSRDAPWPLDSSFPASIVARRSA
jgi:hypothetical protein